MQRKSVMYVSILLFPVLVVASLGFAFQEGRSLSPSTPEALVAAYDSLADAILAVKNTEDSLVRSILDTTMGHAQAAYGAARRALDGGDKDAARASVEHLAAFTAQLGTEGDNAIAGIRKRLVEGGHHHHAAGEMKGIYDEGYVVVTREDKKKFLSISQAIAPLSRSLDASALEAEWKKLASAYSEMMSR